MELVARPLVDVAQAERQWRGLTALGLGRDHTPWTSMPLPLFSAGGNSLLEGKAE